MPVYGNFFEYLSLSGDRGPICAAVDAIVVNKSRGTLVTKVTFLETFLFYFIFFETFVQ
jgi:hypothetical protein